MPGKAGGNVLNLPALKKSVEKSRKTVRRRTNSLSDIVLSPITSPSPVKKRSRSPSSTSNPEGQPAPKRMADENLMAALKDIKSSIDQINNRMDSFATKEDMKNVSKMLGEDLRDQRDEITKLHRLRDQDNAQLEQKVRRIIQSDTATKRTERLGIAVLTEGEASKERSFLLARLSIQLWHVAAGTDLEKSCRTFLSKC